MSLIDTPRLPWVAVPADGLAPLLSTLSWLKPQAPRTGSACKDLAALMVYTAMLYMQREHAYEIPPRPFLMETEPQQALLRVSSVTYDVLEAVTDLSRSMINQGVDRLKELGLIQATGSAQKRVYILRWPNGGRWFKLPCRAILKPNGITAFKAFTMRSKHELNAMKLFFYLADVRSRDAVYSEASYERIHQRLAIPERDIPRAIAVLNASGLLAQVQRDSDKATAAWGANRYFLTGYADLARPRAATAS